MAYLVISIHFRHASVHSPLDRLGPDPEGMGRSENLYGPGCTMGSGKEAFPDPFAKTPPPRSDGGAEDSSR
ncbi:MAG: hypothetical protein CMJ22_11350 [Phycisphaerae bacterium]|nr:hypothetical protein [Phycisphaerae bacterium]